MKHVLIMIYKLIFYLPFYHKKKNYKSNKSFLNFISFYK